MLVIFSAPMDWNARFAVADFVFGREPSQFVRRMEPLLTRQSRLLCVADGEGRNSVYLAQRGHRVDANDASPNALSKAARLAAEAGVSVAFERVDLSTWDWPIERYDAVFAVFIQFAQPPLRDEIFAGVKGSVAPGGRVFLHGYTPKQLDYKTGGPPDVRQLYTEEMLRRAFADCDIDVLTVYEADLDEGEGHKGRSALIDLVARTRPRS